MWKCPFELLERQYFAQSKKSKQNKQTRKKRKKTNKQKHTHTLRERFCYPNVSAVILEHFLGFGDLIIMHIYTPGYRQSHLLGGVTSHLKILLKVTLL